MLSLAFIRDHRDAVRQAAQAKNAPLDLDRLLAADAEVRGLKTRIDELRRQRNEISASFKTADPAERPALGARAKAFGAEAAEAEAALAEKSAELEALMLRVPNIPWDGRRSGRTRASTRWCGPRVRRRASISSPGTMSPWLR